MSKQKLLEVQLPTKAVERKDKICLQKLLAAAIKRPSSAESGVNVKTTTTVCINKSLQLSRKNTALIMKHLEQQH